MESDIDLKNKAVNDLEFRSYSDAVPGCNELKYVNFFKKRSHYRGLFYFC